MKKILFSLVLMAMLSAMAFAGPVDSARAKKAAKTFLSNNGVNAAKLTDLSAEAGFTNLYIYNADKGFVVMAADDRVQPILGYSLTGHFTVKDMPSNVRGWLQGYNDEIQFAVDNNAKATPETSRQWRDLEHGVKGTRATVVVEPLLYTMWDQGDPYNQLCPTITSNGSTVGTATGCVATAMAQIMRYWNWPIKGTGQKSYRWNNKTLSANFGNTTYDWLNMTDIYDNNSTDTEKTAVATLMYHCGVSVSMNYGALTSSGSSASTQTVATSLNTYFSYNTSSNSYKSKSSYNNSQWISMLKTDLDAGRPIQYRGSDASSGGGHSFVCDGYDSDNKFHFNWGWSGYCDGFYALTDMEPGTGGIGAGNGVYTQDQAAIFGIEPNYNVSGTPTLAVTLTQDQNTRNANLSWSSVSNVNSYQVFRNHKLIATTNSSTRSYTDVNAPYGNNVYQVRGVNSSNQITRFSTAVTVAFENPTNLVVTLEDGLFNMSWNSTVLAHSYNVYCNGYNIGSTSETELSFTLGAYGDLEFFVTAVDFNNDESMPSNVVSVNQPYQGPVVTDLEATPGDASASLIWTSKKKKQYEDSYLSGYSGQYSIIGFNVDDLYWAIRLPASTLSFYAGMALQYVNTYIYGEGTYDVSVYQCLGEVPSGTPVASASNTYAAQAGWTDITFGQTVYLDITKDLWVVFHTAGVDYPIICAEYPSEDGDYISADGNSWFNYGEYSWGIWVGFADDNFTYNVYRNGSMIAENMTDTTYVDSHLSNNAAYQYTVKTNYYGRESAASNFSEIVFGEATHEGNLTMKRNDNLLVLANGKLTVTGALNNTYPYNLVIQPGAQVMADNAFSGAYLKRVNAYSEGEDNDGWQLLSSPVYGETDVEDVINLIPDDADDYDLYWFDQVGDSDGKEWLNYKVEGQQPAWVGGTGRLYANKNNVNLAFVGLLNRQPENGVPVVYESGHDLSGFNLIGNPLTCDAYITNSYYRMNEDGSELIEGEGVIKAGEGVFVQVSENGNVNFTKEPARQRKLSITVTMPSATRNGASTIVDRASVRLDGAGNLAKNMLNPNHSKLCFTQEGKEYAVVGLEAGQTEIPINFKATRNGKYTLCFSTENLDLTYLHLIDNMTGADIDLLNTEALIADPDPRSPTTSYTFNAKTTDYASRFKLVFNDSVAANSDTFAYYDGNVWNIGNEGAATLQVIDVMGRIVKSETLSGNTTLSLNQPAGVYMLRLINGNNVKTQKVVVR